MRTELRMDQSEMKNEYAQMMIYACVCVRREWISLGYLFQCFAFSNDRKDSHHKWYEKNENLAY